MSQSQRLTKGKQSNAAAEQLLQESTSQQSKAAQTTDLLKECFQAVRVVSGADMGFIG